MVNSAQLDSGRFWLPDTRDNHVGGWLDLSTGWPQVTLADPLTPAMRESQRDSDRDGRVVVTSVPADDDIDPDTFTVHGHLRRGPRRITLVGASSAGRHTVVGSRHRDQGEQRLHADYMLIGGHVAGDATQYDQVRLQLSHLDEWAGLPGVATEVANDGSQIHIDCTNPSETRTSVPGLGDLILGTAMAMPNPTVRGANVTRRTQLTLELAEPLGFDEIWRRFVEPTSTLLRLCVDSDSHIEDLRIRIRPQEPWLEVRHPMIVQDGIPDGGNFTSHEMLFPLDTITLSNFAQWLVYYPNLMPIPGMVAALGSGGELVLANQLLELAIAAEGLHRRFPAQPPVVTQAQAKAARRTAREAVDPAMRDRVNDALYHLDDPIYAERLRAITDLAAASIPEAMGDRTLWEREIKSVRNGFAHGLPNTRSVSAEWRRYLVLLRTLRWVLITALLNHVGVNPSDLGDRLRAHRPYQFQLRQAYRWAPDLYRQES